MDAAVAFAVGLMLLWWSLRMIATEAMTYESGR